MGMGSADTGKMLPAQIQIFDDYEKMEKPGSKPKGAIKLENAKIESTNSSPVASSSNSPAYASAVVLPQGVVNISPANSVSSSSSSHNNLTPSNGGTAETFIFTVATGNGELHEFRTDTENDRIKWVKVLQLLVMYPHSRIPEEPDVNPIKDSFRQALDAKLYNASKSICPYHAPFPLHINLLFDLLPTSNGTPIITWPFVKYMPTKKEKRRNIINIWKIDPLPSVDATWICSCIDRVYATCIFVFL